MLELLIPLVGAVFAAISGAANAFKFVREGERAVKLRFGKAVRKNGKILVILPGLRVLLPFADKLATTHVRQRTINLPSQTIVLSDNTVFEVSAVLLCRVRDSAEDLYNALFETTNFEIALTDVGLIMVNAIVGQKVYSDLFGESREEIGEELAGAIQARADEWGLEIIEFALSDCKPDEGSVKMIQTTAQANFRMEALDAAAKKLKVRGPESIDPSFASVLVGAPLVATASNGKQEVVISSVESSDE